MMPTAFFGHGAPTNTLATNRYTQAWSAYAASLPPPRAILVVSAHWYVPRTRVTGALRPRTIHDFNAHFPAPLFAFSYPALGDSALVQRIIELARPVEIDVDESSWGLDHGAYSVLAHAFPAADVAVVQLAIDRSKPPAFHYELARRLAPLRDEGVFIMSSGNVVHNLELADRRAESTPAHWAQRFDARLRELLAAGDHAALIDYQRLGNDARLSIPTPDHFLPLIYTLGLQRPAQTVTPIVDGFALGTIDMLSISLSG